MKIATLTPLQQKIYFAAKNAKDGIIFLDIIHSWKLAGKKTLLVELSNMIKKGWLMRLRNGVYLVSEPNLKTIKDAFSLATYIFPGYVSFSSALYVHRLTDMVPFEVQVATRTETGFKKIGEYSFRAIPLRDRYLGSERKNECIVSNIPKTLYDCFSHPELAGGFPQILKAIHEAHLDKTQWAEFLYFAEQFDRNAFFQRLGYLLSILPKQNKEILNVIKLCRRKVKSKIYLFKRRKGKYIAEWKLIDDIGKQELLSWWY